MFEYEQTTFRRFNQIKIVCVCVCVCMCSVFNKPFWDFDGFGPVARERPPETINSTDMKRDCAPVCRHRIPASHSFSDTPDSQSCCAHEDLATANLLSRFQTTLPLTQNSSVPAAQNLNDARATILRVCVPRGATLERREKTAKLGIKAKKLYETELGMSLLM